MYTDLLSLVVDVAITFYKAVKGRSYNGGDDIGC